MGIDKAPIANSGGHAGKEIFDDGARFW